MNAGMILPMTDVEEPTGTPRTIVPFVAAAAVFVVIIAAIVIAGLVSPAEDNVTESDRIQVAVADFVGAHNGGDELRKRSTECEGFDEKRSVLAGRDGKVTIELIEGQEVNGDRGKAQVTTKVDGKDAKTDTWNFVRTDGKWRVCN